MGLTRCTWAKGDLMTAYHDNEWGRPTRDDQKLYQMLLLEGFQAGLSWQVVWSKRDAFSRAFDGFDAHQIAAYGQDKVDALMQDPGIIRCRQKIEAAIRNARVFLDIQREWGSFAAYLYSFTPNGRPVVTPAGQHLTTSPVSDALSRDLRRRGMGYMGSVTVYSFLQAVGVVNDHEPGCFFACPAGERNAHDTQGPSACLEPAAE